MVRDRGTAVSEIEGDAESLVEKSPSERFRYSLGAGWMAFFAVTAIIFGGKGRIRMLQSA